MARVLIVDDSPSDLGLLTAHINNSRPEWVVDVARSGVDAIAQVEKNVYDLVLSDLRMPVMDGIELIGALKHFAPELPVIIVTARGSEELAVVALAKGAASYVAKNQLAERLIETIEQVIKRVKADNSYGAAVNCLTRTVYEFSLENDLTLIPSVVDLLQQVAYGTGLVDTTERRRLGVALEEAILNAMYHGNLELPVEALPELRQSLHSGKRSPRFESRAKVNKYRDRRVVVSAEMTKKQASFVVRDDGKGTSASNIPDAQDPRTLEKEGGRGLVLIRSFMDDVALNDRGNEITMVKHRVVADPLS